MAEFASKILSYLWGIETSHSNMKKEEFQGFYLTYEELKQIRNEEGQEQKKRFYLTYEELKHCFF